MAEYIVTASGDSGPGTLRNAIAQAIANPGADTIVFDPSVTSVSLASALDVTGGGKLTINGDYNHDGVADVELKAIVSHHLTVESAADVKIVGVDFLSGHATGEKGSDGASGAAGANGANGVPDEANPDPSLYGESGGDGTDGHDGGDATNGQDGEDVGGSIKNSAR